MSAHSVVLDVATALAPPRRCAACGAADLRPLSDESTVAFHCPACGTSWTFELGTLVRAPVIEPAGP